MIKNPAEVERAKREHVRTNPLPLDKKFALLNAMYGQAKRVARLPYKNKAIVKKHKLQMARILNAGV